MTTNSALMTTAEVADYLRRSTRHVQVLKATGKLPHVKQGYGTRFRREDVEALLTPGTAPAQPAQRSWQPTRWSDDARALPQGFTAAPSRKADAA
jgi:excisionase family DNA binding protein